MSKSVALFCSVTFSSLLAVTLASQAATSPVTVALCPVGDDTHEDGHQLYYAADGSRQRLTVSTTDDLHSSCAVTTLQVDGSIVWSAPAAPGPGDGSIRQVGLLGNFATGTPSISEVVVIADPGRERDTATDAEPAPEAMSVESPLPRPISSPQGREQLAQALPPSRRGAWLWSPQLWQRSPEVIWRTQSQQRLTEIYISIPVDNTGQVADQDMLSRFLTEAHDRELDVRVVIGDPRDVLPASLPALESRILAFLNYNGDAPASARLSGVQLDIEPYLLRGFARAQSHWRERYLSVVHHVHNMLDGRMSLDLVMPAWWGSHRAWGELLFSQLPVADTRLSIMNYHTSAERLRANAAPFLDWGQRSSVPVLIALESGYLPDETHRRYRHHEQEGELWLLPVGDESVYVLFDKTQSGLAGRAFAFAFDYRVPAGDYTFAGDVARLNSVVTELAREWQNSSAFAGIAIHGLDDSNVTDASP